MRRKLNKEKLKADIIKELNLIGYDTKEKLYIGNQSKLALKEIQNKSRIEQLVKYHKFLISFNKHIVDIYPKELNLEPDKIDLELIHIEKNDSFESKLFRWWNLAWWSVPYQQAYGRQMRFLIWDKGHNLPFGLIGLQSPILKMSVRDNYLEIPNEELDYWINRSMTAQRLGALPPYNELLGGKMVALSLLSNELKSFYNVKYSDRNTRIKKRVIDSDLLFITTTSAFGKSSIYNRLKYNDELVSKSLGFTKGAGSFHINERLFSEILDFLKSEGVSTERAYGAGPSKRVKLLSEAFSRLGIKNYQYHNIKREFYIFELVSNLKKVWLQSEEPKFYDRSLCDLYRFWYSRYCYPRMLRKNNWQSFKIDDIIVKLLSDLQKA
jgi:hypothetical protein